MTAVRGVVLHAAGDLRVEDLPEPEPAADEVIVAVEWGGICGSDLSYWRHGCTGTAVLRDPLVLGHEIAGRISSLGSGVSGFEIGDAVAVHPAMVVGDPTMPERLAGRTNLSPDIHHLGSAARRPHTGGGFVRRKAIRSDQLRALPPGVDTRRGALAEPLGVALHAISRVGGVAGRDVLVNGAGPIGALLVAAAKWYGARSVVAADVDPAALRVAAAMGADEVVDPRHQTLPERVLIFEASGAPQALAAVLGAASRGGTVVQVGNLPGEPTPAALGALVTRELTWIGSYRFVDEISDALTAMADGLDVTPVMTHAFDLEHAEAAFRTAADPTSGRSKVMLQISDEP